MQKTSWKYNIIAVVGGRALDPARTLGPSQAPYQSFAITRRSSWDRGERWKSSPKVHFSVLSAQASSTVRTAQKTCSMQKW